MRSSLIIGSEGYFIQPTVFTNVRDDMKIAKKRFVMSVVEYVQNQ